MDSYPPLCLIFICIKSIFHSSILRNLYAIIICKEHDLIKYLISKVVFHLDTSIYDKNYAEKLEARWKSEKMKYEEIIITPSKSAGKYWQIKENTQMKQKGIIRGVIDIDIFFIFFFCRWSH